MSRHDGDQRAIKDFAQIRIGCSRDLRKVVKQRRIEKRSLALEFGQVVGELLCVVVPELSSIVCVCVKTAGGYRIIRNVHVEKSATGQAVVTVDELSQSDLLALAATYSSCDETLAGVLRQKIARLTHICEILAKKTIYG